MNFAAQKQHLLHDGVPVPDSVPGALHIAEHSLSRALWLDPNIKVSVKLEMSTDGGTTWTPAGQYTAHGGIQPDFAGKPALASFARFGLPHGANRLLRALMVVTGGALASASAFAVDAVSVPIIEPHHSIAYVQSVKATGAAVTSITTAAINTTSGNLLVADCAYYVPSSTFSAMSDSASNSWANSVANLGGTTNSGQQNYVKNCTGNASHTFTLTLTASGYPTLNVTEVSSADTTAPLDKTATGSDGSGFSHTTANTATTSQANEILLGFGVIDSGAVDTLSVSSPWTQSQNTPYASGQVGLISAYQNVTSTGAQAFAFATVQNNATRSGISTWKEATGGAVYVAPRSVNISQAVQRSIQR